MNNNIYLDIKNLGQVFTPIEIVDFMISLIKNGKSILEPSAGDGKFIQILKKNFKKITAIEIDNRFCQNSTCQKCLCQDFFNYSLNEKFDTIIGNPPYVKYNRILKSTLKLIKEKKFNILFDKRTNLYQYFIYKSILHLEPNGELIFIIPREFLKATSSIKLNEFIYQKGTITDFIDLGDKKIFNNASPSVIIIRFEKNNFTRKTKVYSSLNVNDYTIKNFILYAGQLFFLKEKNFIDFNKLFFVKVGAVSGADKCFEHPDGIDFVCSFTNKTKKTKKMIYNQYHPYLEKYKDILLNRKIKKFNENNWWEWGRKYYKSDLPRIYVNCKTRNKQPFFIHKCKAYDGSLLAIFPKFKIKNENQLKEIVDMLNNIDWNELGFVSNGRFIFSQRSLEKCLLPNKFKKFL